MSVLTYLSSSLQSSLQNQTKREGYEKDDFVLELGYGCLDEKTISICIRKFVMKEIDYIFQNLDIKGFLDQIKKDSGEQSNLGSQVLDNVKNSNEEVFYLIELYVSSGFFFKMVNDFSLIYKGEINFETRDDGGYSIICFYSKMDKNYRLLLISFGEKDFYELIKIYEQKPSIQIIKDEFNEFLENLNKDPEYKCYLEVYNYKDSDFDLEDETKEAFKEQINLERE